ASVKNGVPIPALVNALAVSADGTGVYVGGEFRTINGTGPARLQELKLSDGQKVASFKNLTPNKSVFDLKLLGGRLYVAGAFTKFGTTARGGLATLDPATGDVTTAVTTAFAGVNRGGVTTVRKIDVTPSGDRLIAIGNFTSVAGLARVQVAMLDTSGSSATVASWYTNKFPTGCSGSFDTYMHDVDLSPDGSFFVIVTTGGWGGTGSTCDSVTRWETYGTGVQNFTWIDFTGGDTFWAVEVTGPVAYAGGHFRWLNNPYTSTGNSAGPGAVAREGLVAIDTRNGLPFSWNPGRKRGVGVFDFLTTAEHLWAGSDTSTWAGERRDRLAAFPFAGGKALPADKLGTIPGDIVQLDSDAITGADVRARYLTGSGTPATTTPSSSESWSSVRGAVMIDNKVYTGWSDGTFKVRTFDGTSFGAASNVNLFNGTFAQDLPKVTSMFFDRRDGRLYFTLPNSAANKTDGGLYYRYFTPESGVVGAVRWDQSRAASQTAIDGGNIRGAFLVGDQLYFVDKAGVLKKITFNAGQFSGSASVVNNTIDWRARGVFASTAASASAPNTPPVAGFTFNCFGLSCTFDGGTSTDSDGSITNYAWDFGDASTSTDQPAAHTFGGTGTYPVKLTVTDNRGGTNSTTTQVSVTPVNSSIAFRTSGEYAGGAKATHNWTVPAGVQAGDTMLLYVTGSTAAVPSTPSGWTVADGILDTDTRTVVFTKTAAPGDAGSPIQVTWTDAGTNKATVTTMSLAAYSGVASINSVLGTVEDSGSAVTAHTAPDAVVPKNGDWVVSYWSDKNSSTTGWTEPFGQLVRSEPVPAIALGTVRVTALLTDDGGPAAGGARAGLVATANSGATKATAFTVVLSSS
ncbi:MAG TPA: PKD domain-containing protein, partial [Actinomycetes bacterium]|nr:PKD domain-containing protein [Actinomycetes bacterium]